MDDRIHVLGIAGSLRHESYNKALLHAAGELLPEGMTLETYDISEIPMYDGDVEAMGIPDPVKDLKEHIRRADGLIIATPEYNFSVPGVLKNTLDWASRPPGDNAFNGKPLAIMGATAGNYGTVRAQMALRQIAVNLNMFPINKPEVLVTRAQDKFDARGRLVDQATRQVIRSQLEALKDWILQLQAGAQAVTESEQRKMGPRRVA